jgi:glycerophosphoryl diester phosphodiesterase
MVALCLSARSSSAGDCTFKKTEGGDPLRFAHRGWIGEHPEDTIGALLDSYAHGYNAEFDVVLTKDEQLVVLHDTDVKRVAGVDKKAVDMTVAELKALQLLTKIGSYEYPNNTYGIPTYAEVLAALCAEDPHRVFVVDVNLVTRGIELEPQDVVQAELVVSGFASSACRSDRVIFTLGHPTQAALVRSELDGLGLRNPTIFWYVPDTWPLGAHFWVKTRFLWSHARAQGVELHTLVWNDLETDLAKMRTEGSWCLGVFGPHADDFSEQADMVTVDVPERAWKAIGDKSYPKPITYTSGKSAYRSMVALAVLSTCVMIGLLVVVGVRRKKMRWTRRCSNGKEYADC